MIDLTTLTARKVAEAVRRRELTAVAVTQAALERVDKLNATLHAFITVMRDDALAAAADVDRKGCDRPNATDHAAFVGFFVPNPS